jgi:dipeptidyl aminopeptidase/acylaminoacyl peptidase
MVRSQAHTLKRLLLAAWLSLAAEAAGARPFTVEDMVQQESFGRAAFDPTGRWVVYERRGPHAQAPSFAFEPHSEAAEGRLRLVDLASNTPPRSLVAGDPFGLTLGPISPDGRRVAIYALKGATWRLGIVTLATGATAWFGLTPEFPESGRTVIWLSAERLLVIARSAGDLPRNLRMGGQAAAELPARWAATAQGFASMTAVGSGRLRALNPVPAGRSLVRLDLETGASEVLANGAFEDMEVSPDQRRVALTSAAESVPLASDRPVQGVWGTDTQRRRLDLLDLASGRRVRPCADCDLTEGLLSWSPSGRVLLVFARKDGTSWPQGSFLQVSAEGANARPLPLETFQPVLQYRPEWVHGLWMGEIPVVRAQSPGGRIDWVAVTRNGPVALTRQFVTAPTTVVATGGGMLALADGRAWRLGINGATAIPAALNLQPELAPPYRVDARTAVNDPVPRAALAARRQGPDGALAVTVTSAGVTGETPLPTAGSRVLAYDTMRQRAVTLATDERGVLTLVVTRDGRGVRLDEANTGLAEVDPLRVTEVVVREPGGSTSKSWLYQPAARASGRPPPLVVTPYPGLSYRVAPTMADFVREIAAPNVPALVGAGYAVLLPSLPIAEGREPLDGLADQVLRLVDAAAAQAPGAFDPDRLALWGNSYGGYGTQGIIGQTRRFRAAIEAAGPSDLISQWGAFQPSRRIDPGDGLGVAWTAGWTETLQGAMGAPPWADPSRYVRNSPLFQAGGIETPLLIFQGDQDVVPLSQGEEMFSALYRQDKDAMLVTYWGESHLVRSPGNLRDLYQRAFAWLGLYLNPAPGDVAAPPPASLGSAPATTGPSSPPQRR